MNLLLTGLMMKRTILTKRTVLKAGILNSTGIIYSYHLPSQKCGVKVEISPSNL